MLYEVELLRKALEKSDIPSTMQQDPEDWDRFVAEFIVNFWHRAGYQLAIEKDD